MWIESSRLIHLKSYISVLKATRSVLWIPAWMPITVKTLSVGSSSSMTSTPPIHFEKEDTSPGLIPITDWVDNSSRLLKRIYVCCFVALSAVCVCLLVIFSVLCVLCDKLNSNNSATRVKTLRSELFVHGVQHVSVTRGNGLHIYRGSKPQVNAKTRAKQWQTHREKVLQVLERMPEGQWGSLVGGMCEQESQPKTVAPKTITKLF